MEGEAAQVATLLGAMLGTALATLLAKMGIDKANATRQAKRDSGFTASSEAAESVVSRAEAERLAAAAAARAAKDAETIATLQALRASIDAHEHRDVERFTTSEKRSAEQHGAMMAELTRLGTKLHDHANRINATEWGLKETDKRLRETRRVLGVDSGVHRTGGDDD